MYVGHDGTCLGMSTLPKHHLPFSGSRFVPIQFVSAVVDKPRFNALSVPAALPRFLPPSFAPSPPPPLPPSLPPSLPLVLFYPLPPTHTLVVCSCDQRHRDYHEARSFGTGPNPGQCRLQQQALRGKWDGVDSIRHLLVMVVRQSRRSVEAQAVVIGGR